MGEKFAFRKWANGASCPAHKAFGHTSYSDVVDHKLRYVIDYYDEFAEEKSGMVDGVIPEKTAKEAWLEAIDKAETRYGEPVKARKAAEELGWL